jgi:hypothetical protein
MAMEMAQVSPAGGRRALVLAGVAALAAIAIMLAGREDGQRLAAAGLLVVGLAAGYGLGVLAGRRPSRRQPGPRPMVERVNDVAFALVLTAVWGLALALAGAWAGLVTGLLIAFPAAVWLTRRKA